MLIYLDNCCYNRPFDEQAQVRVRLETIAKLTVQLMMACGRVAFVWSKILDYELSFNPYEKRRTTIRAWRSRAAAYVETTEELLTSAEVFERQGVKPKDALHLASAAKAGCDWFLTTDRGASVNFKPSSSCSSLPTMVAVASATRNNFLLSDQASGR